MSDFVERSRHQPTRHEQQIEPQRLTARPRNQVTEEATEYHAEYQAGDIVPAAVDAQRRKPIGRTDQRRNLSGGRDTLK